MMLNYYYGICIFIRFILAFFVYYSYMIQLRYVFILFYFIIGIGAIYQYIVKTRNIGAFNNHVWWDNIRPVHSILFLMTSAGLLYKYKYSYIFILMDTLVSIVYRYYVT